MVIKDDMENIQEAVINELITENGITNTLADGQVIEAKIADNAVTTAKIADGSVTVAKLGGDVDLDIADNEVTTTKINNGAVTLAKLGGDVDLGQVNDGAVTPAKLDRAYLETTGGTVSGNVGIGDSVPSEKLNVAGNVMLEGGDQYLYLTNAGTGNSGIYVRGNTSGSYLRSHSTGSFTWEITGSEKMRIQSDGTIKISNSSEPSTPSGGGVLYVQNGALKFKGSSGTVTTIANA